MGKDKQTGLVRERRNGMPTRRVDGTDGARYTAVAPSHQQTQNRVTTRTAQKNQEIPNHPCIEQRGNCHNPSGCPYLNIKPNVCWMLLKHGTCNGRSNGTCQWDHPRQPLLATRPGIGGGGGGGVIRHGPAIVTASRPPGARPPAPPGPGTDAFPSLPSASGGPPRAAVPTSEAPRDVGPRGDSEESHSRPAPAPAAPRGGGQVWSRVTAGAAPAPAPAAAPSPSPASAAPHPPSAPRDDRDASPGGSARGSDTEDDDAALRIAVPSEAFQRIIGRNGKRRHELQQQYGVTLTIPGPDAAPDAQIVVTGPRSQAEEARRRLEEEHGAPPIDDAQEVSSLETEVEGAKQEEEKLRRQLKEQQALLERAEGSERATREQHENLRQKIEGAISQFRREQREKEEQLAEIRQQVEELRSAPLPSELDQAEAEALRTEAEVEEKEEWQRETARQSQSAVQQLEGQRRVLETLSSELDQLKVKVTARRSAQAAALREKQRQRETRQALEERHSAAELLRDLLPHPDTVAFRDSRDQLYAFARPPEGPASSLTLLALSPSPDQGASRREVTRIEYSEGEIALHCHTTGGGSAEVVGLPAHVAARSSALQQVGALAQACGVRFSAGALPLARDAADIVQHISSDLRVEDLIELWQRQEEVERALRGELHRRLGGGRAPDPIPSAAEPPPPAHWPGDTLWWPHGGNEIGRSGDLGIDPSWLPDQGADQWDGGGAEIDHRGRRLYESDADGGLPGELVDAVIGGYDPRESPDRPGVLPAYLGGLLGEPT
eukprot:Hpha_TRINITY_DN7147_c0_g1::TRINITY_DN7147_c0_g1_i1::g.29887::m.29887